MKIFRKLIDTFTISQFQTHTPLGFNYKFAGTSTRGYPLAHSLSLFCNLN